MSLPAAFTESLRYDYALNSESVVVDCGGFKGDFADGIFQRHNCRVFVFEPVSEFYDPLYARFLGNPKITAIQAGVGVKEECVRFGIQGALSGQFNSGPNGSEEVQLIDFPQWIKSNTPRIDLLKLNIEGMEYDVIEALLDTGMMSRIVNLQVQFHPPNAEAEAHRLALRSRQLQTHGLTYDFPNIWENFQLKAATP